MSDRAELFRHLHDGPVPFRLVNAWDALSARVFALAGAPAVATSSFAVALAHGYSDGEQIPWPEVCRTVQAIVDAVDVPVSVDIEAGRGLEAAEVETAVRDVITAGAVGLNLEDRQPAEPRVLIDVSQQCERIAAARAAGGSDLFINARCDVFFGADIAPAEQLDVALSRATRYLAAGADGIFLPGLLDLAGLRTVATSVSAPLNAMLWPGLPTVDELADAGVRRISQGGAAFLAAVAQLARMTGDYLEHEPGESGGDVGPAFQLLPQLAYR